MGASRSECTNETSYRGKTDERFTLPLLCLSSVRIFGIVLKYLRVEKGATVCELSHFWLLTQVELCSSENEYKFRSSYFFLTVMNKIIPFMLNISY